MIAQVPATATPTIAPVLRAKLALKYEFIKTSEYWLSLPRWPFWITRTEDARSKSKEFKKSEGIERLHFVTYRGEDTLGDEEIEIEVTLYGVDVETIGVTGDVDEDGSTEETGTVLDDTGNDELIVVELEVRVRFVVTGTELGVVSEVVVEDEDEEDIKVVEAVEDISVEFDTVEYEAEVDKVDVGSGVYVEFGFVDWGVDVADVNVVEVIESVSFGSPEVDDGGVMLGESVLDVFVVEESLRTGVDKEEKVSRYTNGSEFDIPPRYPKNDETKQLDPVALCSSPSRDVQCNSCEIDECCGRNFAPIGTGKLVSCAASDSKTMCTQRQ
ncbi:hypothetical protein H0H92_012666 [Tricholoma furcatifolium]|nr:hypothetical protein H0H92_012666 [Tricholoma furcatifolium]